MRQATIHKLRFLRTIFIVSFVLGMTYPIASGQIELVAFLIAGYVSIAMPACAFGFELFYVQAERGAWVRRLPFAWFMIVKLLVYLLSILFNIGLAITIFIPESRTRGGVRSIMEQVLDLEIILNTLSMFLLFSLFMSINDLLGRGVLRDFISGKYHRPRREKRVFLFMDMVGSTAIAEKLGDLEYHRLLNRFFSDLATPILENRGFVDRYIGDELIASWPLKRGVASNQCVRAVLEAHSLLERLGDDYEQEFGFRPVFRAGMHMGDVVTGEMGDAKREIAYVGDVMNTTSRIENACRELDRAFLISGEVLKDLHLPDTVRVEDMGNVELRGKGAPVPLYSIPLTN